MATRRWNQYKPPSQVLPEDGNAASPGTPPAKRPAKRTPKTTPKTKAKPKSKRKPSAASKRPSTKRGWLIGLGIAAVVIGGPIAIANGGDGDGSDSYSTKLRRDTLSTAFITTALERAKTVEGDKPVRVDFSDYDVSVDYYDPNREETRSLAVRPDDDGYRVDVRKNEYDKYSPRPFALDLIDPDQVVSELKKGIEATSDPAWYTASVSKDFVTGDVELRIGVEARGDDKDYDKTILLLKGEGPQ